MPKSEIFAKVGSQFCHKLRKGQKRFKIMPNFAKSGLTGVNLSADMTTLTLNQSKNPFLSYLPNSNQQYEIDQFVSSVDDSGRPFTA